MGRKWACSVCGHENAGGATTCEECRVGARPPGPPRLRLSNSHGHWSLHKTTVFTRNMGKALGPGYVYLSPEQLELVCGDAALVWHARSFPGVANRTYLNDDPLGEAPRELKEGDVIRVGELRITIGFEHE